MDLLGPSISATADFDEWIADAEPRIRHALTAAFGPHVAGDATADATAIAWERWDDIAERTNRDGYVYGIARNLARRSTSRGVIYMPPVDPVEMPHVEPALPAALASLSERQRTVVGLVHGYGWTLTQVALLLGLSKSTVQNHLERGTARLRTALGVES